MHISVSTEWNFTKFNIRDTHCKKLHLLNFSVCRSRKNALTVFSDPIDKGASLFYECIFTTVDKSYTYYLNFSLLNAESITVSRLTNDRISKNS